MGRRFKRTPWMLGLTIVGVAWGFGIFPRVGNGYDMHWQPYADALRGAVAGAIVGCLIELVRDHVVSSGETP